MITVEIFACSFLLSIADILSLFLIDILIDYQYFKNKDFLLSINKMTIL